MLSTFLAYDVVCTPKQTSLSYTGEMSNIQVEKTIKNNGHMNTAATIEIPVRGI
jgi:hypothetical protein